MDKEYIKLAKNRWELIRRHPGYINDYKDLQNGKFQPRNCEEMFCLKWFIGKVLYPEYSYEQLKQEFGYTDEELYDIIINFFYELYPPVSDSQNLSVDNPEIITIDLDQGLIDVTFNMFYDKKIILFHFEKVLDKWQKTLKKRKKIGEGKGTKRDRRGRLVKSDDIDLAQFFKISSLFHMRGFRTQKHTTDTGKHWI